MFLKLLLILKLKSNILEFNFRIDNYHRVISTLNFLILFNFLPPLYWNHKHNYMI